MQPEISVIMPVCNAGKYVGQALCSILGQTFYNLELIVVDDGSADDSMEVVSRFNDPRIRLLRNPARLGIASSLNRGIDLASSRYVARMDADDISAPERLAIQSEFLEKHSEVVLCGTWARQIDAQGRIIGSRKAPTGTDLRFRFWRPSPFIHPSVMIRTEVAREFRYNEDLQYAEDYDLWLRICEKHMTANIPEYLLMYRIHENFGTDHTLGPSYNVFKSWLGSDEIDFETFVALVRSEQKLSPSRRFTATRTIAKRVGLPLPLLLMDHLSFTGRWLSRRVRGRCAD